LISEIIPFGVICRRDDTVDVATKRAVMLIVYFAFFSTMDVQDRRRKCSIKVDDVFLGKIWHVYRIPYFLRWA